MNYSRLLLLTFVAAVAPAFSQTSVQEMSPSAAARFLDQASWGPTPGSIQDLQIMGIPNWLRIQFALNTSNLPDQPMLGSDGKPNHNLAPVKATFFQNTVAGPDQLRQRVAFALSQIWVVSSGGGVPLAYAYPPYWRLFRDNAFGNYRDVIRALTLSPAMGRYLNMANNNKANPAKNTSANENYARELMQLFTLGLTQLNLDGSPVLDQNKHPIPTYDQAVVANIAEVLTGWTYPAAPGASPHGNNPPYYIGQMFAVESEHDMSAKTIFAGALIPAGQSAERDLELLIDALMAQPTMAPFVRRQLIQHLVTSNPSSQYVARVSTVFHDDGEGVTGNLQAVVTAILTDPEARAGDHPAAPMNGAAGHLREPVLFMPNILRGLNATLSPASTVYHDTSDLSENLFNAPSVFAIFPRSIGLQAGCPGRSFRFTPAQTAADRANIVNAILYGRIDKGTTVNLSSICPEGQYPGRSS